MATSSTSIGIAQVPVSCYFCNGQEIKWTCVDCNVRMCNSCKVTVHQGLQCAQDHDVVSIQDISESTPGSQEVTSVVISSVFNSYTTTLPAVHSLLCSDDDLLYFIYNGQTSDKRQLVKGKLLKSSIKILQMLQREISDIAMNKDGEILFIEHHDHKIQVLSHTGEVKTVLDSSPMILLAIHVNKDNEVIVDYAYRIRTDSRNVVYVIDRFDNDSSNGRIVAVDRNGRLKFIYDGQKDTGTFQPKGITITPSDNIVVADYYNEALHVINSKGDLLGLQFIFKDLGFNDPFSLCFDTEGYLLIGCGRRNNEDCGKIHVVKMVDSLV
ncbi:TRIM2_3 [Mytilus edulis]|uniref:TRIM2_3 n=1 Tax=Mytilus edulis TaxID=6550 RepID=A0A8S3QNJ1_MYTED|nr:TRIM2_3 [Mytilus edulis]